MIEQTKRKNKESRANLHSVRKKTLIDNLNCFERIKVEFQKIVNLLDTTSGDKDLPRFVTKK